jgi:hypothetical protein
MDVSFLNVKTLKLNHETYRLGAIQAIDYDEKSLLSPCLVRFSTKYFKTKRASRGSLIIMNIVSNVTSVMQRDILGNLNEDPGHAFGIMVKNGRLKHGNATAFGVTDKAKSYMMMMTTLEDLEFAIKQWKSLPTWNPLAQTVVVSLYPMKSEYEKEYMVKSALGMLYEVGIIYANVVFHMEKTDHILETETWFPYDGDQCADKVDGIVKIDECIVSKSHNENGKLVTQSSYRTFNDDKHPKLPFTFHQCPLQVSAFVWEPFVVENTNTHQIESGLEITMLNTITEQMNLRINYKILDKSLATKKISSDNQTGIYADLIQK